MRKIIFLICFLFLKGSWASEFVACKDANQFAELTGSLCTTIEVPLVYEKQDSGTLELFVRQFPALKHSQGQVWLVAGGPGESGASFYSIIDTFRASFANFDIFVADHRGTGFSSAICQGEHVDSVGGKVLVGEEWGQCFSQMYSAPQYVKAFNITHAAKDLQQLITKFSGQGQTFIYSVSYGTQLVLRASQLQGFNVDGIILDSLVPMQDDGQFDLSQRSHVVNMVGEALIAKCDKPSGCNGVKSQSLKQKLSKLITTSNNLNDYSNQLPQVSLTNTLGTMLDVPHIRNRLPDIIQRLSENDIEPLVQAIADVESYYGQFNPGYGNFGSSIPLVQVITASENNLRPKLTKAEVNQEQTDLLFTSPLPSLIAENSMPTYDKDAFYAALPTSLPRTLVIHGSLDPKTHLDGAIAHSEQLAKRGELSFIKITDGVHFSALNAPSCFKQYAELFISKQVGNAKCQDEKSLVRF
ncbi:alpha/beta fold hydrolase [Shewanella waksmanii]|uniref:alpha/beta fold hydrolase n=1 Tax=Shewanella waksmanii TaxID=213783 RepID=UPI0037368D2C